MFIQQKEFEKPFERVGDNKDRILGTGLLQPFNSANSASRKQMFQSNLKQALPLNESEVPILGTGYENRFGDESSVLLKADKDYRVISFIPKYLFNPLHHYYCIVVDTDGIMSVIEKIPYRHVTETYGIMYNFDYLDSLYMNYGANPNNIIINKDQVIRKTDSYDESMNYKYGVNLRTVYLGLTANIEDSLIISESAEKKLRSRIFKPVSIIINENDIPLNMYGNNNEYKIFPDIGEYVNEDGRLLVLRRDLRDRVLYNQSIENLSEIHLSDNVYELSKEDKVVDIEIYCNNVPNLDKYYNAQLLKYYNESMRCARDIVNNINVFLKDGYKLSYDLDKLFYQSSQLLNGVKYNQGGSNFSNILLKITTNSILNTSISDKITNRYGGKGVMSTIVPDEYMPRLVGSKEPIELIMCSDTVINRENIGQLFELSINHISEHVVREIKRLFTEELTDNNRDQLIDKSLGYVYTFLKYVSRDLCNFYKGVLENVDYNDKYDFLKSLMDNGIILVSNSPMNESMDIFRLDMLYKELPFVTYDEIESPIQTPMGIKWYKSYDKVITGKIMIMRLKQYAEEKFSATSLASLNSKNENARNKRKSQFQDRYSSTPIMFGNMEIADANHAGADYVLTFMMIQSLSPQARKRIEELIVQEDPYNIDIKLDVSSKNVAAEIAKVLLSVIGYEIIFQKIPKNPDKPLLISPVTFPDNMEIHEFAKKILDMKPFHIDPVTFDLVEKDRLEDERNNK